jgi:hypothetical protein
MAELNNPNDTINQKSRKDIDEEFDKEYCSFITNDGNLTTDKEIRNIMRANGIYRRKDMKLYNTFYRYPRLDPYNMLPTSREYVFFTKPDLHIFRSMDVNGEKVTHKELQSQLEDNGLFKDLVERGYAITLSQLQASVSKNNGLFINLLTNRKVSALDLTDMQADSYESARNFYGTIINYRKSSEMSDENVEFSIEFEDTKWLEIYLMFRAYDEYEKLKWYGKVCPPKQEYIWYKILHDQFGIFKFIVAEDGETILHWSQFWGVYPTNIPRSAFSDMPQDGHMRITVSFKAQFVEDMNKNTLADFNAIANTIPCNNAVESKVYNQNEMLVSGESVQKPYVVQAIDGENLNAQQQYFGLSSSVNKFNTYKLKWYTSFDRDVDD